MSLFPYIARGMMVLSHSLYGKMFVYILLSSCLVPLVRGACDDTTGFSLSPYSGARYLSCTEVADQYPYHCTDASSSNIWLNPDGHCCATCNALPNSVKKCTDLPGPGLSITGTSITGRTCAQMANDWPYICKPSSQNGWGGNWNTCCKSCKNVDYKTCVSQPTTTLTINYSNGTSVTVSGDCPTLQSGGYCNYLGGIKNVCCATCPCTDNPNASVTVTKGGVTCTDCTCAELAAKSPDTLVHLRKACCKNKNNARNDCCAMCKANIKC